MPQSEKSTSNTISFAELKEKHTKKTEIETIKAKIEQDWGNSGQVFQINNVGIVRATMKQDQKTGENRWSYSNLTNFTIKDLSLIENLDTKENTIKMVATNVRGVERTIEDSVKIFDETKNFREALNSMHYSFKGNVNDLQDIRECIVSNVLIGEDYVYRTSGFRIINDELVYITSDGALKRDGIFDEALKVDVDTFKSEIKGLELITAEEVKEIRQALNNFNTPDIVYPVLGSAMACNFVNFFNQSKDGKLHILFITGESSGGKNKTMDHVIIPLLNINYKVESCTTVTQANFFRSSDESCTLPIIYDEHTLRNLDPKRKDMIYGWIRMTTEQTTTKRVARGKDERLNYKTQAPMMVLGENEPSDTSILNRCNLVFMSKKKRESDPAYEQNFMHLCDNEMLLRKIGYTLKKYILDTYNQEVFEKELTQLAKVLNKFKLGSREFKTFKDCVFGISALNGAIKHYTGEVLFQDLNQIAQIIYENIVENVTSGSESTTADYIKVLEIMDMMIQEGVLKRDWHYVFDTDNDVIKLDIKRSYIEMLAYVRDKNIKLPTMECSEFVKKIKNSDFIAGTSSKEYYKSHRLFVNYKTKALQRVYLLKMNTCRNYDFMGLSNQVEIEPSE